MKILTQNLKSGKTDIIEVPTPSTCLLYTSDAADE